jgi:uncharacterized protein (TIGR03435 family)
LIAYAYGVQPAQIVDLKSRLDRYDVEGKADGAYSQAELRVMLQGLLAGRFRLKFHRETREIPVERLVIGKDLKLKATALTEADPRGFTLGASDRGRDFLKAKASAMSLEWLADSLSGHLSKLVVDGTGLKGVYEFEVDFEFDRDYVADRSVPFREARNHTWEGLISALGLKLQSGKKEQVEVLVIDQVEQPEANQVSAFRVAEICLKTPGGETLYPMNRSSRSNFAPPDRKSRGPFRRPRLLFEGFPALTLGAV